jgi:hypothetical protein
MNHHSIACAHVTTFNGHLLSYRQALACVPCLISEQWTHRWCSCTWGWWSHLAASGNHTHDPPPQPCVPHCSLPARDHTDNCTELQGQNDTDSKREKREEDLKWPQKTREDTANTEAEPAVSWGKQTTPPHSDKVLLGLVCV